MAKTITLSQFNIELNKDKKGEFYFRKRADNREPISKSTESYSSKQMALHGLKVDTLITLRNINAVVVLPISLSYVDKTGRAAVDRVLLIEE